MMKLLYIINIAKRINNFSESAMKASLELGIEFHIAGNFSDYQSSEKERLEDEQKYGIKIHQVDFIRKPYNPKNIKAYKQVVNLIKKEKYDIIHCNTPIGGVVGRLAGKKCGVKTIIYQAHGFHFYKGAPVLNWMIYYPIERWLAHYTDYLITINQEDYELAKNKMKLHNGGRIYYVAGVGVDISQYNSNEKAHIKKRTELGLQENDIAIISMGDLIERKNYDTAIRAVAETKKSNLHYFICGKGPEEEKLKLLANGLGISSQIHFLGFRSDIKELLEASDIFLFTTKQEGLPRSLMEAMASGLPCIISDVRGNKDLISDGVGGYLCKATNVYEFASQIKRLANGPDIRKKMSIYNINKIKKYDVSVVQKEMSLIYREMI